MTEIVNLRRARKAKARVKKEQDAAQNRARFGTSKPERTLTKARSELADRDLVRHRLDPDKPLEK